MKNKITIYIISLIHLLTFWIFYYGSYHTKIVTEVKYLYFLKIFTVLLLILLLWKYSFKWWDLLHSVIAFVVQFIFIAIVERYIFKTGDWVGLPISFMSLWAAEIVLIGVVFIVQILKFGYKKYREL